VFCFFMQVAAKMEMYNVLIDKPVTCLKKRINQYHNFELSGQMVGASDAELVR